MGGWKRKSSGLVCNTSLTAQPSKRLMLELRQELAAQIEWEEADFECPTQTEIDAVAHRILRMAELLRR